MIEDPISSRRNPEPCAATFFDAALVESTVDYTAHCN